MNTPVWITGIGALTPIGNDFATIGKNLLDGYCAIEEIRHFEVTGQPSRLAAPVKVIPAPSGFEAGFEARSRLERSLLWCLVNALRDAGLWEQRHDLRIGLCIGIGSEWLTQWEVEALQYAREPTDLGGYSHGSVLEKVKRELGLTGPSCTASTACASGNYTIALARRWLQFGWTDACLAGACDMNVCPMTLASFGNLRALSRRNDDPKRACRPFDKQRDGFVMAEGGTVLVLESSETAARRGARVYGELAGVGMSSDAFHPVIPSPNPQPAVMAIQRALHDAGVTPEEIDYVNAHGTSTPVGDASEARILREVFGAQAARVPVSATKSMTGHLLTAAAALEAVVCLTAFAEQTIPPTINLEEPDPECELRHVANHAEEAKLDLAMSNSFGFGGNNSCAVFRRVSRTRAA